MKLTDWYSRTFLSQIHAGWFGGIGLAGPYPVGGRLPADAGDRHGQHAGAHHDDEEGFDHVRAGHLRAGGRFDGSRSGHHLRSLGRDDGAVPRDRRAGHLPGGGPVGFDLAHHGPEHHRPGALQRRPRRAEDPAGLQVVAGHHRHSGHGRVVRGGQADGGEGAQDPEVPIAAVPGGRGVYGSRR